MRVLLSLQRLERYARLIITKLETIMGQQEDLNDAVQAINDSLNGIEGEVASLEAQIAAGTPAEQLDLSGLKTLVARAQADVPAAVTTPVDSEPVDAEPVEAAPVVDGDSSPVETAVPDADAQANAGLDPAPADAAGVAPTDETWSDDTAAATDPGASTV